jgi:hypothetical protein
MRAMKAGRPMAMSYRRGIQTITLLVYNAMEALAKIVT